MGGGEAADAEQRHRYRDIRALARTSSSVAIAPDISTPWPARITGRSASSISSPRPRERSLSSGRAVLARPRRAGAAASQSNSRRRLLRVLGDVEQHRPGPSGSRHREGLAHRRRHISTRVDQVVVLGDRQRDAGDVGFLERVRANQPAADLAGDADDRRGVHHRRRDAGDHVGRAGTGRRDGDTDFAASRARSRRPCASRPARAAPGCGGSGIRASRRTRAGSRRPDTRRRPSTPSRTRHSQRICAPVLFITHPLKTQKTPKCPCTERHPRGLRFCVFCVLGGKVKGPSPLSDDGPLKICFYGAAIIRRVRE